MKLKKEQCEKISECFPKHGKPAKINNLDVLNAVMGMIQIKVNVVRLDSACIVALLLLLMPLCEHGLAYQGFQAQNNPAKSEQLT